MNSTPVGVATAAQEFVVPRSIPSAMAIQISKLSQVPPGCHLPDAIERVPDRAGVVGKARRRQRNGSLHRAGAVDLVEGGLVAADDPHLTLDVRQALRLGGV